MGNPRKGSSQGGDGVHAAARNGDLHTVQCTCISNPLATNSRDKHYRTPLHLAAWAGHAEVVSFLCKNKADVRATAMDDMGAIHFAAQKGHLEIVRILRQSGVSINASNRKGLTPLHYAVQGSDKELIKYLIRKGANPSAKNKAGKTPLDLAENEEICAFLRECEEASKKCEEPKATKEAGHSSPKQLPSDDAVDSNGKTEAKYETNEDVDERNKRKSDEAEIKGQLPEPKKLKVTLNHLLAGDDHEELEDNKE